jgi:hypothetical protein
VACWSFRIQSVHCTMSHVHAALCKNIRTARNATAQHDGSDMCVSLVVGQVVQAILSG